MRRGRCVSCACAREVDCRQDMPHRDRLPISMFSSIEAAVPASPPHAARDAVAPRLAKLGRYTVSSDPLPRASDPARRHRQAVHAGVSELVSFEQLGSAVPVDHSSASPRAADLVELLEPMMVLFASPCVPSSSASSRDVQWWGKHVGVFCFSRPD